MEESWERRRSHRAFTIRSNDISSRYKSTQITKEIEVTNLIHIHLHDNYILISSFTHTEAYKCLISC
jgi:hypothetical protein